MRLSVDLQRLQDRDERRRPHHDHHELAEEPERGESEDREQPTAEDGAHDADDDVGDDPHLRIRLHQDARDPSADAADDEAQNQSVHGRSSSLTRVPPGRGRRVYFIWVILLAPRWLRPGTTSAAISRASK